MVSGHELAGFRRRVRSAEGDRGSALAIRWRQMDPDFQSRLGYDFARSRMGEGSPAAHRALPREHRPLPLGIGGGGRHLPGRAVLDAGLPIGPTGPARRLDRQLARSRAAVLRERSVRQNVQTGHALELPKVARDQGPVVDDRRRRDEQIHGRDPFAATAQLRQQPSVLRREALVRRR